MQRARAGVTWVHDFKAHAEFDWGKSFHPAASSLPYLEGEGRSASTKSEPYSRADRRFYRAREQELPRDAPTQTSGIQFLTVEMSFEISCAASGQLSLLHPLVREIGFRTVGEIRREPRRG